MDNHIKYFEDVILYNGDFYSHKVETVFLHNRFRDTYTFKDINTLPINDYNDFIEYDHIVLFLCGFSGNMGHLLWDCMYSSWYGLFFKDEKLWNNNFQWITRDVLYQKDYKGWHLGILEKFSGNEITTPQILSNKYNKPLRIKLLISGIKNLGIGCVDKNICVNTSFKNHIMNPVETFINRFYFRYGIKRHNYIENKNDIIDVIYISNKRPYNGVKELFNDLNIKYKNKYNFKYINWGHYTFEEQLNILNTTRIIICGVGTARTNTPFIPNGSVEIQTNHISKNARNNITYFDCHIGTISKYVKVFNINSYTDYECKGNLLSKDLLPLIEKTLNIVPYENNFNIEENLPIYVNNIKSKISDDMYSHWRSRFSNSIEDIIIRIK